MVASAAPMVRPPEQTRQPRRARGALLAVSLLALVSLLRPAPALADEASQRREAGELADRGHEALERGDNEGALALFQRASKISPSPAILLFQARSLVKLGRLVEADEVFRQAAAFSLPPGASEAARTSVNDARTEGALVHARLGRLTAIVAGDRSPPPSLTLRLDGKTPLAPGVEQPIDPGPHRLDALVGTSVWASESFTMAEGTARTVTLRGAASPPPPAVSSAPPPPPVSPAPGPGAQRTGAWVSLGVGGAGLITGVVSGVVMLSKKSDLEPRCPANRCPPSTHDDVDSFRRLRVVSTVGYVVGGVGVGLGALLWFTQPASSSSTALAPRVSPFVGLREAGVMGTF